MPVMDGYHFLKAKEHLPRRRNLPVIIFSGNIGVETLIGSAGVVSAFPKDTSISLLIEAVKLSVPLFK
jgi:CheY-like chemotaxis protein